MLRHGRRHLLPGDKPPLRLGPDVIRPPRRRQYPLAWAFALGGMSIVATASWVLSLYVFGHPEQPLCNAILTRLEQLEPPKHFDIYGVPDGKALNATDAYAKYRPFLSLSPEEIRSFNRQLLREYVTNYKNADRIDYVSGGFRILSVHALGPHTLLPEGIVLRAVSLDTQDLEIEYLMPGPEAATDQFRQGDRLVLEATKAYGAVVHFQALDGDRLCLTLIPLVYGPHTTPSGKHITLKPPHHLRLTAPWPVSAGAGEPTKKPE